VTAPGVVGADLPELGGHGVHHRGESKGGVDPQRHWGVGSWCQLGGTAHAGWGVETKKGEGEV
jgi:hypothetical protein